eukprot:g1749.t1
MVSTRRTRSKDRRRSSGTSSRSSTRSNSKKRNKVSRKSEKREDTEVESSENSEKSFGTPSSPKKRRSSSSRKRGSSRSGKKKKSTCTETSSFFKKTSDRARKIRQNTREVLGSIEKKAKKSMANIEKRAKMSLDIARKAMPKKREDEAFLFQRVTIPSNFRGLFSMRVLCAIICVCVFLYVRYHGKSKQFSMLDLQGYDSSDEYSSSPAWLPSATNWYYYLFFSFLLCGTYMMCFVTSPSFTSIRLMYTCISVSFLLARIYNYYESGYLLYMVDLCYFNQYLTLYALWNYKVLSPEMLGAIYCVSNGPVAGATFMLQTGLELHHPEVFHSFWLHVCPMWITYAIRWRWADRQEHSIAFWRKRDMIWNAMTMVYTRWAFGYLLFLNLHPHIPIVKNYETLFDWYVSGGQYNASLTRNDPPLIWFGKTFIYICIHCFMGLQGVCAAVMCFKYERCHFMWIFIVLCGTIQQGLVFYENSANPEHPINQGNPAIDGLKKTVIAWCFLLPTYLLCKHNASYASGLRKSPRKEKRGKKTNKKKAN